MSVLACDWPVIKNTFLSLVDYHPILPSCATAAAARNSSLNSRVDGGLEGSKNLGNDGVLVDGIDGVGADTGHTGSSGT